jgi:hypothetical protein
MGVKGRQAPGRCGTHVGKASYSDLERALILGHKRRLNINFPKEKACTIIGNDKPTRRAKNAAAESREEFSGGRREYTIGIFTP